MCASARGRVVCMCNFFFNVRECVIQGTVCDKGSWPALASWIGSEEIS